MSNLDTFSFSSVIQTTGFQHIINNVCFNICSLQQINARLNEKITYLIEQQEQRRLQQASSVADSTQTYDAAERELKTPIMCSTWSQTDFKPSQFAKNSGPIKKSKSASDSTNASNSNKEDAHLLATIRGMRVDLAIKEKAMQRLTRELEECKKTIKKTQKEKDGKSNDL